MGQFERFERVHARVATIEAVAEFVERCGQHPCQLPAFEDRNGESFVIGGRVVCFVQVGRKSRKIHGGLLVRSCTEAQGYAAM
ncbi:hypothetical protein L3D22_12930 [Lysobacter soli]|uniref:hypothetical protein n=1 Tax=Lysobacter soli TaxID=453783 RepID=UPI0020A1253E|nr:hypothetical protein [Lysobacter soli]UTA53268.1 hypothetical protein L3D22_12930 [Lysobacter soli]